MNYKFYKQQDLCNSRKKLERLCWQDEQQYNFAGFQRDFKTLTKKKKVFGKTSETMEEFPFVIFDTGLNRPNI